MFLSSPKWLYARGVATRPLGVSLNKAFFDQIRLDHVLKRIRLFADSGSQVFDTDGTALELLNDREQELAVETV